MAVKKVIAAMTVGKDVAPLFPSVVNCVQTEDLELKKLVYLYLINYAKSQPDLALMAVNTFVKDASDPSPIVRALAVRTMGCIRVDRITEYLCDPLARSLKDSDPYVRKTAAICVAKLYDISPELVQERGFLDTLQDLIGDPNPMVVANSVASLAEIEEMAGGGVFQITSGSLFKLLAAMNECTEWGQVFILDSLAQYQPRDAKEAEGVVERVASRLQHANCAVVLSAVKVILQQLEHADSADLRALMGKKLAPPLVSLLSSEKEIQYVALRNIRLVVQHCPTILQHEIKVFFCKYNDPLFIKLEKLEVMVQLATLENIDQVLLEFKEYASEVDVDFVRKAVRAIGRCAISLESAAQRCVDVLLGLIRTRVSYVVQEGIVVVRDIFRRYPNRYESVIGALCENLETLDEPEAKASMVWIIGEYADRIDNADELLESFLDSFPEETGPVQLQLLTAAVKLFLKKPTERPQQMIQLVLSNATHETDNPDIRDRAYIYWRLLSSDPEAAKAVVLSEKPVIADDAGAMDPSLLKDLLQNVSMLASVYHKPAETFVAHARTRVLRAEDLAQHSLGSEDGIFGGGDAGGGAGSVQPGGRAGGDLLGDLMSLDGGQGQGGAPPAAPSGGAAVAPPGDLMGDLLSLESPAAAPAPVPAVPAGATGAAADPFDVMGGMGGGPAAPAAPALPVLLTADKGKGVQVAGAMAREGGRLVYRLAFTNTGPLPLNGFMIQFNKNFFGLGPEGQLQVPPLPPNGGAAATSLGLAINPAQAAPTFSPKVQVAIKNVTTGDVLYLVDTVPLGVLASEDGAMDQAAFPAAWQSLGGEQKAQLPLAPPAGDVLAARLRAQNLFLVASREGPKTLTYFSGKVGAPFNVAVLVEVSTSPGAAGVGVVCKCPRPELAPLVVMAVQAACS